MAVVVAPARLAGLAAWGLVVGVAEIAGVAALFLLGMVLASGGAFPDGALGDFAARLAAPLGLDVVVAVALGLLAATALRAAVTLAYEAMLGRLHRDIVLGATDTLFRGYFGMEYERFAARNSADRVLRLTTELDRAAIAVTALTRTVAMGLVLALMAGLLVVLDWRAAVLGALASLAIGLAVVPLVRRGSRLAKERRDRQAHLAVAVAEPLRAYRDLVTSNLWPRFHGRVREHQAGFLHLQQRLTFQQASIPHVLEAGIALVVFAVILVAGGVSAGAAAATPILVLLVAGAYRFLPTLQRLLSGLGSFRTNEPCLRAVVDEIAEVHDHARHHQPIPEADLGDVLVRMRGVRFAHPGQEDLLRGVDLEVQRGQRVGIVGPSGAGKTTLIDLTLGLLRPSSGDYVRGRGPAGRPLRIAYLPQQPVFVQGTVLDNLAQADEASVDAAEARRLLGLVGLSHVPLDLQLGESGSGLSGGERQRLGLARAMHGEPDLLLLDEPTGALDVATEREVIEALDHLAGVAMLVVTHRKGPLALCETVWRLDDGLLVQEHESPPAQKPRRPVVAVRVAEPAP